ncbi:hypothetical protein CRG98_043775 [Punica granatum]|uniref:Uncharacterized protein n=1 Tax=Punica granatum TaxID=22663 RepID=A0A2I0HVW0_PUNGR|nr:hypothetical protein CRG98_043775 [Punica granatum]
MDSSLSSAYAAAPPSSSPFEDSRSSDADSMKHSTEPKHGFWGALARKAKSIIEDNNVSHQQETPEGEVNPQMADKNVGDRVSEDTLLF